MASILPLLSYVLVATFTPGPNNIMSLTNGSNYGYKKTLRFILGIITGFIIVLLLCSYLNLLLFHFIPKIKIFMVIVGSAYMIYLAVKIFKSKPDSKQQQSNSMNTFVTGLLMQFVNPKLIIYAITVTSNFIIPYYKTNIALLLISILLAFVVFLATSSWALFGALFQKFLSKYQKIFNTVMALLLVYCAVSIILELF